MTDNRTTELLPCPFCGGEAELRGPYFGHWHVGCANTDCICSVTFETVHETKANAITAWNTRAERTCKVNIGKTVTGKGQTYVAICDSCGRLIGQCCDYGPPAIPNYCPNCGAKVIEEVDNADE